MTQSANNIARGEVTILIGPNGYGKTTRLVELKDDLEKKGEHVLFIPSEIKLMDEVKDTVDTSQTMEFLLEEILETPEYIAKKESLFAEADQAIKDNLDFMNGIVDEVLAINKSSRTVDFIAPNPKKRAVKGIVSINQADIKGSMGSGQRMRLLLKLASNSSKQHIFLDEPEKYSHPSLLNGTASAINDLVASGKSVYIATHSPKLVSMLDIDLSCIKVINDASHTLKEIPFDEVVKECASIFNTGALESRFKKYYLDGDSLKDCIKKRHYRAFIETLFTQRVFLCEGANDELYVNASLQKNGGYYGDYCIFKVWGKSNLLVFKGLFDKLGISTVILFDTDDETRFPHAELNPILRAFRPQSIVIEHNPRLEVEIGYKGEKRDALAFIEYCESVDIPALENNSCCPTV